MKNLIFLVTFMMTLLLSISGAAAPIGIESDSGTEGPAYSELLKYFSSLPKAYPGYVQINQYGVTPQGRPLVVLRLAYPVAKRFNRNSGSAILITGSTHGDEYLNIEDRLPEWFLKEGMKDPSMVPFFKAGGMVYIVPIFNPDGYDTRQRGNSKGQDLNRDFSVRQAKFEGFKQVETSAIRDMLANQLKVQNQKLLMTLDYHCCIGAALYPYSFKPAPELPQAHLANYLAAAKIIKASFGEKFPVGKTPDVLGYSAIGTSKDYYYETYGAISFTFEGVYRDEKNKFNLHAEMWKHFVQAMTPAVLRSNMRF